MEKCERMSFFKKFFPSRNTGRRHTCKWTLSEQSKGWSPPKFNRDNVRLVIMSQNQFGQECGVLFDSKSEHRPPCNVQDTPCKSGKFFRKNRPQCPPSRCPSMPEASQTCRESRPRLASDIKNLEEMMFGSAPIVPKGSSLKVHTTKSPPQLMVTKLFLPMDGSKISSEQDSFDLYSVQSLSMDSLPRAIASSTEKSPHTLAQSVPVDVPVHPRYSGEENEDSGFSTSVASSSYSSSLTTSGYSPGSSASLSSLNSRTRRLLRNHATSLDCSLNKRLSEDTEPLPTRKRLGIGITFTFPEENIETFRQFEVFFFSHITLIESHVVKMKVAVMKGLQTKNKKMVEEALTVFRNSIHDLYTAPRLTEPIWLSMMQYSKRQVALSQGFLKDFVWFIDKYDTKNNKFFMSTLITAVLTHHLAWVPTVTPAGATPARTYLDKHLPKWLDALAQSHPYNPLWAQLGDLYGAIGFPLRLSRTVVVGQKADLVCKLLQVLSYFVRCSAIQETSEHFVGLDGDWSGSAESHVSDPNVTPSSPSSSSASVSGVTAAMRTIDENEVVTEDDYDDDDSSELDDSCARLYGSATSISTIHHVQLQTSVETVVSGKSDFSSATFTGHHHEGSTAVNKKEVSFSDSVSVSSLGIVQNDSNMSSGRTVQESKRESGENVTNLKESSICSNDESTVLDTVSENSANHSEVITRSRSGITNGNSVFYCCQDETVGTCDSQKCPLTSESNNCLSCSKGNSDQVISLCDCESSSPGSSSSLDQQQDSSVCGDMLHFKTLKLFRMLSREPVDEFDSGETDICESSFCENLSSDGCLFSDLDLAPASKRTADDSSISKPFHRVSLSKNTPSFPMHDSNVQTQPSIETQSTQEVKCHICPPDDIENRVRVDRIRHVGRASVADKDNSVIMENALVLPVKDNSSTDALHAYGEFSNDTPKDICLGKDHSRFMEMPVAQRMPSPHPTAALSKSTSTTLWSSTAGLLLAKSTTTTSTAAPEAKSTTTMSTAEPQSEATAADLTAGFQSSTTAAMSQSVDSTTVSLQALPPVYSPAELSPQAHSGKPSRVHDKSSELFTDSNVHPASVSSETTSELSQATSVSSPHSSAVSQSTFSLSQPTSLLSQPALVSSQPTPASLSSASLSSHATSVLAQATSVLSHPTSVTYQSESSNYLPPPVSSVCWDTPMINPSCLGSSSVQLGSNNNCNINVSSGQSYVPLYPSLGQSVSGGQNSELEEKSLRSALSRDPSLLEEPGSVRVIKRDSGTLYPMISGNTIVSSLSASDTSAPPSRSASDTRVKSVTAEATSDAPRTEGGVIFEEEDDVFDTEAVNEGESSITKETTSTVSDITQSPESHQPRIMAATFGADSTGNPLNIGTGISDDTPSPMMTPNIQTVIEPPVVISTNTSAHTDSDIHGKVSSWLDTHEELVETSCMDIPTTREDDSSTCPLVTQEDDQRTFFDFPTGSGDDTGCDPVDLAEIVKLLDPLSVNDKAADSATDLPPLPPPPDTDRPEHVAWHGNTDNSTTVISSLSSAVDANDLISFSPQDSGICSEQDHSATALLSVQDKHFTDDADPVMLPDCPSKEMFTSALSLMQETPLAECEACLFDDCADQCADCRSRSNSGSDSLSRARGYSVERQHSTGSQISRQNSLGAPARCRSVTPTELGRRRNTSNASNFSWELENSEARSDMKEVEMPSMLSTTTEASETFDHNFGHSLLAGYTDHYMSDFVLHGTNDNNFQSKLHTDLTIAVQNSVLDEPITEACCIVADIDKCSIRLNACDRKSADRVKPSMELMASHIVSDIMESVQKLWKLKMSPEFCLMHLEDRLQEIYFKSIVLSEYILIHQKINQKELADMLGLDVSDLPLLLAVAGTHTPSLASRLPSLLAAAEPSQSSNHMTAK